MLVSVVEAVTSPETNQILLGCDTLSITPEYDSGKHCQRILLTNTRTQSYLEQESVILNSFNTNPTRLIYEISILGLTPQIPSFIQPLVCGTETLGVVFDEGRISSNRCPTYL